MPSPDGKEMPDDPYRAIDSAPTPKELERRREIVNRMREIRSRQPESGGPFPSTEQMLREDRDR
jgi:hypothetical protein